MQENSGALPPRPWLSQRLRPHRRWLLLSAGAGLLATLATIVLAGLIAWAVHAALFLPERLDLPLLLAAAAAAAVARYGMQAGRDAAGHELALRVKQSVRDDLLEAARADGPVHLAHRGPSGAWAERYHSQVEALTGYYARYLPATLMVVITPLALLITAFWLDWLAAGLLLLSAPLIPAFMALVGMGAEQVHSRQQAEESRLAGYFLDRIRSLDLVRRARATEAAHTEVVEASHEHRRLTMRVLRIAFLSSAIMEFFSAVAIGLVAIYIGFGLFGAIEYGPAGQLTLFTGLFVLLLAPEYFLPLRQFAQSYHDRAGALAAAEALAPLLQRPASGSGVTDRAEPMPESADTCLQLAGVRVRYPGAAEPALREVDLEVQNGDRVAIVGPSGSGKSTLLALCAGFLAPEAGALQRRPEARQFAWIGQDTHLFHGSLRENLQLARREPLDDLRMTEAMHQAGLPVDDPQLPDGLDTAIGEAGVGLSGGQAQRVAIARALLSGHDLWLLDEPTSALDAATEAALLDTLFSLAEARGLTLLIASHQAAVRQHATRVLSIRDGRLEETDD